MATKWKWHSGTSITLNSDYSQTYDLSDISAGYIAYHTLNVKTDGELTVYTTSSTKDTYGWLTDGSCSLGTGDGSSALTGGTVYVKNDDGGSNSNFKYTYDLTTGDDYEIDYHNYYQDEDLEAVDVYIKFYADEDTSTFTYDCYDLTSGEWLDYETETASSSITRPNLRAYNYLGYVYHTSWSNCIDQGEELDFDGTGTKCTGHSSKYPYIVFFYEQPTIYYKCYDITTGTDMTGVTSKVTASAISRPSKSGYQYLGYVYDADFATCLEVYNSSGVDSTSTSYTPKASYPYVIFFYQAYEWTKTLIDSMLTIDGSLLSKSYSLNYSNTGVMAYIKVKPTIDGSLTVYTTGDSDTYGWLTNGNCSTVPGKNGSSALTDGVVYTKNDDTDSDMNFSYSFTTTPNTIYEIDVHNYSISASSLVATLNINFSPVLYTATFDANNGSNAPNSISNYGTNSVWSCIIPTTEPTRSGYDFLGWSTSNSATTASYTAGSTVSFTGDITLYAVWKVSRPTFTWINKDLDEANLLTSYINTYLSGSISYPLPENELIKASWYNAIADILNVDNVSIGDEILDIQLKALEDAYNNK